MRGRWREAMVATAGLGIGLVVGIGCAGVETTPIVPAGAPYVYDQNPVYIPLGKDYYGKVFENVLQALGDFGFEIQDANRYSGRIETRPRTAPGVGFFLKPGSPDLAERLLATAQSYRHRASIVIDPAEQGGYFIAVTVRKELEDLPRPVRATVGAAVFRNDNDVDRSFEVIDPNAADPNWIFRGRDPALEQEIIRRLRKLM